MDAIRFDDHVARSPQITRTGGQRGYHRWAVARRAPRVQFLKHRGGGRDAAAAHRQAPARPVAWAVPGLSSWCEVVEAMQVRHALQPIVNLATVEVIGYEALARFAGGRAACRNARMATRTRSVDGEKRHGRGRERPMASRDPP